MRRRAPASSWPGSPRRTTTGSGASFRVSAERRVEGAARVGEHRTSMLQDIEAARATELDALLGSVIELAARVHVPVPRLEAVYACTRLLEQVCVPASHPAPERSAA